MHCCSIRARTTQDVQRAGLGTLSQFWIWPNGNGNSWTTTKQKMRQDTDSVVVCRNASGIRNRRTGTGIFVVATIDNYSDNPVGSSCVFFCAGRCAKQITRIHFASTRSRTTSSNSSIAVGRHCFPIPFCLNPKKQPQKRVNFDFDKIKKLKEKKK